MAGGRKLRGMGVLIFLANATKGQGTKTAGNGLTHLVGKGKVDRCYYEQNAHNSNGIWVK